MIKYYYVVQLSYWVVQMVTHKKQTLALFRGKHSPHCYDDGSTPHPGGEVHAISTPLKMMYNKTTFDFYYPIKQVKLKHCKTSSLR